MPKKKKTAESAGPSAKTTIADVPADASADAPVPIPAPVVQQSPLLNLPQEIKQKIWKFAVKVNNGVKPVQMMPRSNKFVWSDRQVIKLKDIDGAIVGETKKINAVKQLTVMALVQTCHQVYDEVSLTNLFYQVNHFDFRNSDDESVLAYLVAITDARRNNIRCISMNWPTLYWGSLNIVRNSMTVIASCAKLEVLVLHFPKEIGMYHYGIGRLKPFQEAKLAIQGLKTFELLLFDESKVEVDLPAYKNRMKIFMPTIEELRKTLNEQVSTARGTGLSWVRLREAHIAASLDIHGGGRLGPDKKPTVSSRTRNQLKNAEKVDKYGIIPERQRPKYDVTGELVWSIHKIKECREVLDDGGSISTIEYLCEISTPPSYDLEDSWEDVSVLGNSLGSLWRFYLGNESACGKQFLLELLKPREANAVPDDENKDIGWRWTTDLIVTLERIIKKLAKREKKAAQAAAKKTAKKPEKKTAKANKVGATSKIRPAKRKKVKAQPESDDEE